MSYKVIKKIKGNLYLYLQTSFRAGGKVKTKSVYLGAVSGGGGSAGTGQTIPPPSAEGHDAGDIQPGLDLDTHHDGATPSESPTEPRGQAKATQTPPQSEKPAGSPPGDKTGVRASAETMATDRPESGQLHEAPKGQKQAKTQSGKKVAETMATAEGIEAKIKIKIDLERHRISEKGLLSVLKNQISTLQGVGLDTSKLAKIKLVYSSVNETEPRHKKSLLSSNYKVYIPAYHKGNRTKFLQEYRRAVAKQGLDLVRSEDPALYSQIKSAFDESYKRTNQALSSYLLATTDKNKSVKAFIVRFFGIYHGKMTGTQQAEDLGLTDTTRETWTDEYADIMGDIAKRGYKTVLNEWEARHYQATLSEKRATTARFRRDTKRKWYNYLQVGYMDRANASLRRAIAKRQAQSEAVEKIKIIGRLYKLESLSG